MADTFTLEIVSPTQILFSGEVESVTAPAIKGEFGVLTGHTEYLTVLSPGEVRYTIGGSVESMVVGSGYSEVGPLKTIILIESATRTADIDVVKVEAELKEAAAALDDMQENDPAYRETLERRDFANAMIEAAGKAKAR